MALGFLSLAFTEGMLVVTMVGVDRLTQGAFGPVQAVSSGGGVQ